MTISSLVANGGPAIELLEEPAVDTVESEDDEGCVGWPRRAGFICGMLCGFGADVDLFSERNWGVLEKA